MDRRWIIAAAVDPEIRGLRKRLDNVRRERISRGRAWSGTRGNVPVWLVVTGVGPACAAKTLKPLMRSGRFCGVLSIGYAGALEPSYKVGDIVVPDEVQSLPPLQEGAFQTDPVRKQAILEAARLQGRCVHTRRMLTSHRVIASTREKISLGESHAAGSVEMESAVVGDLARSASMPFLVVRAVSDEAGFSMPDNMALLQDWSKGRRARAARYLLTRPVQTLRLLRLFYSALNASRSLTDFLLDCVLDEGILSKGIKDGT